MSRQIFFSKKQIFFYGLPMISGGFINFVIANYLLKFATDTLFLAPATVGLIFALSRIYDAISDPLLGYLSDRYPLGQNGRLNLILISSFVLSVGFLLLFLYPYFPFLSMFFPQRVVFFAINLFLLFTGLTLLYIPHYALAAELSSSAKEQSNLFGSRAVAENLGTFLGVLFVALENEKFFFANFPYLFLVGFFLFTNILVIRLVLKEKKGKRNFLPKNFLVSLFTVLKEKKSQKALAITFLSQLAATFMLSTVLYFSQYVLRKASLGPELTAIFLFLATLAIPFWVFILQKRHYLEVWPIILIVLSLLFLVCWPAGKIYHENFLYALGALIGFFAGALLTINPLALAQAIHFNQEKGVSQPTGMYFAIFTFVNKLAMALAVFLVGWALQATGFTAGAAQSSLVQETIRLLFAILPSLCFLFALIILGRPKSTLP